MEEKSNLRFWLGDRRYLGPPSPPNLGGIRLKVPKLGDLGAWIASQFSDRTLFSEFSTENEFTLPNLGVGGLNNLQILV